MAGHSAVAPAWVLLLLGVLALGTTVRSLITGKAWLFYSTYTKSKDPGLYWFSIIMYGGLSVAVIVSVFIR